MSSNNGEGCLGCGFLVLMTLAALVFLGMVSKVAFGLVLLGWEMLS